MQKVVIDKHLTIINYVDHKDETDTTSNHRIRSSSRDADGPTTFICVRVKFVIMVSTYMLLIYYTGQRITIMTFRTRLRKIEYVVVKGYENW